ncbi:MAG TPA: Tol-Pal system beta propeller repeat protein TolB, partial [Vicinamibacteria bacterium]
GESILFVSFARRGILPVLALATGGPNPRTLFGSEGMTYPGAWSPDGSKIAFSSSKDGNAEIYVMDRDGSRVERLTNHPSIDVSPTWSPTGREIAFTSDRSGSPQIYIMDADGLNLTRISLSGSYNAEPAWSPSTEFSEIAYATRVRGGIFDIVIHDLLTKQIRQITQKRGLNESPSWAPNGRHLAFASTRTGDSQIFTVNRDGSNMRQLTFEGMSTTPSWGPAPR